MAKIPYDIQPSFCFDFHGPPAATQRGVTQGQTLSLASHQTFEPRFKKDATALRGSARCNLILSTLDSPLSTFYSLLFTLFSVFSTLYSLLCALYSVPSSVLLFPPLSSSVLLFPLFFPPFSSSWFFLLFPPLSCLQSPRSSVVCTFSSLLSSPLSSSRFPVPSHVALGRVLVS